MFENIFNIKVYAVEKVTKKANSVTKWTSNTVGRKVTEDPLQKYRFKLKIPNYDVTAGFSKCSGLVDEIDVIEYCEGIWGYTHRIPGRTKVEPVTLERGAYSSYDGMEAIQATRTNPNMRNTMVIEIGRSQSASEAAAASTAMQFSLYEAWVSKVEIGDLDATSGDILIEKMTVQYEYIGFGSGNNAVTTDISWKNSTKKKKKK